MVLQERRLENPAHAMLNHIAQKRVILIMCHTNPDPDSIAAAFALKNILHQELLRRKVVIGYDGIVGRAENRQLVRRLKIEMTHVKDIDFKRFSIICLVDCQPRTGNSALPRKMIPDIVIDHHPLRRDTMKSSFYDVRSDYGSSSTIMVEYLRELNCKIDEKLATALFYGLKTDTNNLIRSSTKADLDAFNYLFPKMNPKTLAAIENPSVPKSYYLSFANSIDNSFQYKEVIISRMGKINNPDMISEMADFLLRMEGIKWTLCMGEYRDDLLLSVRTTRKRLLAGRIALRILRGIGKGGGHEQAAGGKVELNGLPAEERFKIKKEISRRFLKALGIEEKEEKPLRINKN